MTLDVPAGTVVGIMGPNGSGKTTLFNLIAGMFPRAEAGMVLDLSEDNRIAEILPRRENLNRAPGSAWVSMRPAYMPDLGSGTVFRSSSISESVVTPSDSALKFVSTR